MTQHRLLQLQPLLDGRLTRWLVCGSASVEQRHSGIRLECIRLRLRCGGRTRSLRTTNCSPAGWPRARLSTTLPRKRTGASIVRLPVQVRLHAAHHIVGSRSDRNPVRRHIQPVLSDNTHRWSGSECDHFWRLMRNIEIYECRLRLLPSR